MGILGSALDVVEAPAKFVGGVASGAANLVTGGGGGAKGNTSIVVDGQRVSLTPSAHVTSDSGKET